MHNNDSNLTIRDAISNIAVGPGRGRDISLESAKEVMEAVLEGEIDPVQAAIFFISLRMKGESLAELKGLYEGLQANLIPLVSSIDKIYYIADPFDGSTRHHPCNPFLPATLAANGINSVSVGLSSVGPKHGANAYRVLRAAGVEVDQKTENAVESLSKYGWTYLDQAQYLPSLYELREFRDQMVKRTAITTLERLVKPILGKTETNIVIGYVHKAYLDIYKVLAHHAGFTSCLLTKGVEGGVVPALNKPLRSHFSIFDTKEKIETQKLKVEIPAYLESSVAGSQIKDESNVIQETLEMGLAALSGKTGFFRNSLVVSAATILSTYQPALSFAEAVVKVENCLDNGTALEHFQLHATHN